MEFHKDIDFVLDSDRTLLVRIAAEISAQAQAVVWALARALRHPAIRNLHPGYGSLLISFDPLQATHAEIADAVRGTATVSTEGSGRLVEIPVCYGGEFGPDLGDVAGRAGITQEQAIALHSGAEYLVYFLGFSPGFAYLGGLPEALATPRLPSPRTKVPAGSVGIGGKQTGVYPLATAGGWRIIGRTPLALFRPDEYPPVLLRMGDRVRFVAIGKDAFEQQTDSR